MSPIYRGFKPDTSVLRVISTGGGIDEIMTNKLRPKRKETADLLRKHGGKTGEELM
jgi:hypothetical protein